MERLIKMYLDYWEKFLTIQCFAEWYGLDIEDARTLIDMGRKYYNRKAKQTNQTNHESTK